MDAMMKFSELDRELAARAHDGVIGTYTTNGVVDEESQKNDLDIVDEVLKVTFPGAALRASLDDSGKLIAKTTVSHSVTRAASSKYKKTLTRKAS